MPPSVSIVLRHISDTLRQVSESSYDRAVSDAIGVLVDALTGGRKLLVFGNGGSSADAQHLCAELVGRFTRERPALPAIALTTNQALLTAWSNDYDFESVFVRQLEAFGQPGDVALGISTSGNSENVVRALRRARELGLKTLGLTGAGGGRAADHCDVLMAVPLTDTPRIQEVHLVTYHVICAAIDEQMFGGVGTKDEDI